MVHCSFALLHGLTTYFWNVLLTLQDGHNIVQGLKNADGTEKRECHSHVEHNIIWYCRTVGRPLWSSIWEAWVCDQFCSSLPQMCSFLGLHHLCNWAALISLFYPTWLVYILKLSFTWEWVIVLMWVYTEIIVFLTMHSHIICTLVLMDLFELWWLISKYFCTLLNISVICPNFFEQSYILVTLEPL